MANNKNLKRGNPATQFKSGREAVENGRKGGIKADAARKAKVNLRDSAQTILEGTYKVRDKQTGEINERTGAEVLVLNTFSIASDPKNRNCIAATKLLMELTGANKSPESIAIDKATAALIQAKADMLTGADTSTLDKLDDILREMRDNADIKR